MSKKTFRSPKELIQAYLTYCLFTFQRCKYYHENESPEQYQIIRAEIADKCSELRLAAVTPKVLRENNILDMDSLTWKGPEPSQLQAAKLRDKVNEYAKRKKRIRRDIRKGVVAEETIPLAAVAAPTTPYVEEPVITEAAPERKRTVRTPATYTTVVLEFEGLKITIEKN